MKLLSTGNPKVLKGIKQGYNTYILHLAPADLSGFNTCPKATAGCKAACLNTAGRGGMFKKGEIVKVKAVIPSGPVQALRFNGEGNVEYLVEWTDVDGNVQQRWFLEDQLEA